MSEIPRAAAPAPASTEAIPVAAEAQAAPVGEAAGEAVNNLGNELGANASAGQALDNLGEGLGVAPERTPDNAAEASARKSMNSKELRTEIDSRAGWKVRALNRKDRVLKTSTLLTAREMRYEGRVVRLQKKYDNARPGSRKRARLEESLHTAKYRRGLLEAKQNKILGRMHERSYGFKQELEKVNDVEKKRNDLLLKRKTALEMKRRRKLRERYHKEMGKDEKNRDPRVLDEIHKEMKSWVGSKFKKGVEEEIQKKYAKRVAESRKL